MQWITLIAEKCLPSTLPLDRRPELKPIPRNTGWLGTGDYEHNGKPDGKFDRFEIKSVSIVSYAQSKGNPGDAHWRPNEGGHVSLEVENGVLSDNACASLQNTPSVC